MFDRKQKTPDAITGRVSKGFTLLDRRSPGWFRKVNLDTLNIGRSDNCALGQTYGSYEDGLMVLGIDNRQSVQHGFQATGLRLSSEMELLTLEWRRQIEERLDTERAAWEEEVFTGTFRRWWGRVTR